MILAVLVGAAARMNRVVPYDREACVFDPSGRVRQIEYAEEAVNRGEPAVALASGSVVVLCATVDKLCLIDAATAATYAGLRGDGRGLVDAARQRAARERLHSGPPSPRTLAFGVADVAHECARGGGKRAYGARLVLVGFDGARPEVWSVGPGGDARRHPSGAAVGRGAQLDDSTDDAPSVWSLASRSLVFRPSSLAPRAPCSPTTLSTTRHRCTS